MSDKQDTLNREILSLACEKPGITIAQTVDTIFQQTPDGEKWPSRDTIRRRIYRLGALGYLSLRKQITLYPTEKARKFVGNGTTGPKDSGSQ